MERVWLHLREGRINEAVAAHKRLEGLAEKYHPSVDFAWSEIQRYAALARAYLASAQRRFDDAISTLKRLRDDAIGVQNHYFGLRVATHLSVVRLRAGQTTEALAEFHRVLGVSVRAGIHQTILDEGEEIGPLLAAFEETTERPSVSADLKPYVNGLLAAWRSCYQSGAELNSRSGLAEPLSAREGEILNLIAKGLSNKEIARNLAIAPETVKSHVKNIFVKLDAEKRAQAVARAQSLGLVATK